MGIDKKTLAAARTYTDDTVAGAGAVAGKPCQIQDISAITGGNRVTFLWVDNNNTEHTSTMDVMNGADGADGAKGDKGDTGSTGKGVSSLNINSSNHLIVTYTDATTSDAGEVPTVQSDWDQENSSAASFIKNKPTLGTAAAKDFTPNVAPNNHNLVESNAVYNAINTAVSSVYTPRGELACAELTADLLIADNVGSVYEMSDSGTTSNLFLQGAGKEIAVGQNVGVIQTGVDTYKFNLMGNSFDLHNYQTKVQSATNGNFAGLDATGQVTDSGKKASDFATAQGLENEAATRSKMGAKNYLQILASGTFVGNGITFVVNDDGTVTVSTDENGATGDTNFYLNPATQVWVDPDYPYDDYILSGCPSGGSAETYRLAISRQGASSVFDTGTGANFTHASGVTTLALIQIGNGTVLTTPITFKPMIRLATDANADYQPYVKTNRELAEDSVTWDDLSDVGAVNLAPNGLTTQTIETTDKTLTIDVSDDKVITLNGGVSTSQYLTLASDVSNLIGIPIKIYDTYEYNAKAYCYISYVSSGTTYYKNSRTGTFTIPSGATSVKFYLVVYTDETFSNFKIAPMVAPASYNGPYVPYAMRNKDLTDNVSAVQSALASKLNTYVLATDVSASIFDVITNNTLYPVKSLIIGSVTAVTNGSDTLASLLSVNTSAHLKIFKQSQWTCDIMVFDTTGDFAVAYGAQNVTALKFLKMTSSGNSVITVNKVTP